jgi:hypothetical protein
MRKNTVLKCILISLRTARAERFLSPVVMMVVLVVVVMRTVFRMLVMLCVHLGRRSRTAGAGISQKRKKAQAENKEDDKQ